MKRLLPFLFFAVLALPAPHALGAAWDITIQQRDGSSVPRSYSLTSTGNQVIGTNATGGAVMLNTIGSGNVVKDTNPTLLGVVNVTGNVTATGNLGGLNLSGTNTGDQALFQNIVVSGQTTVTANSTTGNLTLAAGSGISLATDNTTKTVTITNTGGGGGGGSGNVTNNGTLTPGYILMGDGTTVVKITGATYSAANGGTLTIGNVTITGNGTFTSNNVVAQNITLTEPVPGAAGGTGVANTGKTITVGGNFTTSGAHTTTLTTTGNTTLTLPTSGTVATLTDVGGLLTYTDGALAAYAATTKTLTNTTLDAGGTGNVLKFKSYLQLTYPHRVEGSDTAFQTADATVVTYGHVSFSHGAAAADNWCEYFITVPEDIDTSVALRARLKVILGGADTATHRYVLSSVSVADSAVPGSATLANAINLDFAGDGAGASGDVRTSAWTTLTSWAGALTAGQTWRIRLARSGDATEDASTVASHEFGLEIEYGVTQ